MSNLPETEKMPVLFIGHGSPLNIISQNSFTESLKNLSRSLSRPKAIMVISAHWLTSGVTEVTAMDKPRTIHDFQGFPAELYEMKYPAPGAPEYAGLVKETIPEIKGNTEWGLDHASWAVLKHMYPEADIPVFELSLDYAFGSRNNKPIQYHYDLAAQLQPLRTKGILIIGSGNIVHNLKLVNWQGLDVKAESWAVEMDERVKANLLKRNHEDLIHYLNMGRTASMGIPSLDHYLPMIYTAALQRKDETLKFTYEGFQNGTISMRGFQIG
jgi:4,5-DOPA dioxygenase extradiol